MIVRMDKSGLGTQSRSLARLLEPDKLMVIDSSPFNHNEQYPSWYKGYEQIIINGFPTNQDIFDFLQGLTEVWTAETYYNNQFINIARERGVKTYQVVNYEFWDNLRFAYFPVADQIIMPSYWHLEEMQEKYGAVYLPTPIWADQFQEARETNLERTGEPHFLFINGKSAVHDRNGLYALYEALPYSKRDYKLTIKAQNDIKKHPDPRIIYDFTNPENHQDLYKGFDAMVHPRRYGGQTLTMTEALNSALPVIMPDIDPNNKVLPQEWLVPATVKEQFQARTVIDVYDTDPKKLAELLDTIDVGRTAKMQACAIGQQYDADHLREKYAAI